MWQSKPSPNSSLDHDISDWGVYGRIYHANGTAAGDEFLINSNTEGDQSVPAVAALDDGFVVVWHSATGNSGFGIFGQRFENDGEKDGSEFLVNTTTGGHGYLPEVSALQRANAGEFVVSWASDLVYRTVYARAFDETAPASVTTSSSIRRIRRSTAATTTSMARRSPARRTAISS